MAEVIKRFLSRYEVFIMFGISNENLSIGDFLLKNFPDYYPLCIVSEMQYLGEDYVKDWDEYFVGFTHEFRKDNSALCQKLRDCKNFDFKFDDTDNETLIITVFDDFYPDGD